MKFLNLCSICIAMCLVGCTLEAPPQVAEDCPNATYYSKGDGTIDGYFSDDGSAYHRVYSITHHCPAAYPICAKGIDASFCHETCRDNEVFCSDKCIKPLEDKAYCGARGLCMDADINSPNYRGQQCAAGEICRNGVCDCAKNWEISCGGKCIDPSMNDAFCGARGKCNDSDDLSDNYRGQRCREDEICQNGICVCASSRKIRCGDACIDPTKDATHCGARGSCSDVDRDSANYRGQSCLSGERCTDGTCACARSLEISCDGKCINPNDNMTYCGARSLCSDETSDSDNYRGVSCHEGQICENGICKCAKSREISCDSTCIDPAIDNKHCGAVGRCDDPNSISPDFIGGICDWCEGGECMCDDNKHIYNHSCEIDDETNCGAHGNACSGEKFVHAAEVKCLDGECVVTACEPGTFLAADGKSCTTCAELIRDVHPGDIVQIGHYRQLYESEERQPIDWIVLDIDDQKGVLVLSKWVLMPKKYSVYNYVTWKDSQLRAWLNGLNTLGIVNGIDCTNDNFILSAFSNEEQTCIQTVTNENPDNPQNGAAGGEDTEDRVFLLSVYEAGYEVDGENHGYFSENSERNGYATDYASRIGGHVIIYPSDTQTVRFGEHDYLFYSTIWWLRTPGVGRELQENTNYSSYGTVVLSGGSIDLYGVGVGGSLNTDFGGAVGVRPAMWIK